MEVQQSYHSSMENEEMSNVENILLRYDVV